MIEDAMSKSRSSNREKAETILETINLLRTRLTARQSARISEMKGSPCQNLTLAQLNAVRTVRSRGEVTIKALAKALNVSAPSASTMVERLVEMGILEREQSSKDRREVLVRISRDVCEEIDAAEEDFLKSLTELMEQIGPEMSQNWFEVYACLGKTLRAGEDQE
jgi:DNA-binding MarR family transcriptional regulator